MSSRDWRFRIQDILKSIQKIETYIESMTAEYLRPSLNAHVQNKPFRLSLIAPAPSYNG